MKCNRCGVLFEPVIGDLVITELNKYVTPPKGSGGDGALWTSTIYDEEREYDLCTACSADLREFLKPIKRPPVVS